MAEEEAQRGGGRREEGQPGAHRVPQLLQQIAPDPEPLPPVEAAIRQDRLPCGAQVVLELLKLGRRRALPFHCTIMSLTIHSLPKHPHSLEAQLETSIQVASLNISQSVGNYS